MRYKLPPIYSASGFLYKMARPAKQVHNYNYFVSQKRRLKLVFPIAISKCNIRRSKASGLLQRSPRLPD